MSQGKLDCYYCDNCGDVIYLCGNVSIEQRTVKDYTAFSACPFPTASTNALESAAVCRECVDHLRELVWKEPKRGDGWDTSPHLKL